MSHTARSQHRFFASAAKGIEPLLGEELGALGAEEIILERGGVSFRGNLVTAYRVCLWSRTANRVLLPLAEFSVANTDDLYLGSNHIPWEDHLSPDGSLAVDVVGANQSINHSHYAAQRVKDAVVDRLRERYARRPSVQLRYPDLRINAYLSQDRAIIHLDLSGESLHRRGYRRESVVAPLKENLAAALLLKTGWRDIAASGGALLDPLCGSGTLLIEGGWIAADIAPGLLRPHWGFQGWLQHDAVAWNELLAEARQRRAAGLAHTPPLVGFDRDARALRAAMINTGQAGLQGLVRLEQRPLADAAVPAGLTPGLVIANPPYGERLGELGELESLYAELGDVLKSRFTQWRAAVFTGNPELGKRMGLRARRINSFYNGAIACKLLDFAVSPEWFVDRATADARSRDRILHNALKNGADMFANRLRKNVRTLGRWAQREGIQCYRLYDADIPEYAVAIDRYESWLHVQEYAPPKTVDSKRARERLEHIMAVLPSVLDVAPEHIFLKVRKRQQGRDQYGKHDESGHFFKVREDRGRFWVNLSDYLDTGLFLDHRLTRKYIAELAPGRRFLNLFAYTGSATVYAAWGGATNTTSVDLSQTYLDWTQRNLELNTLGSGQHRLIRADCLRWLDQHSDEYDLIFLDPPTFSNSKRMQDAFDVQRDHAMLIHKTLRRLSAHGVLIFSTNRRRFTLERNALADLRINDISARTLPQDFKRTPEFHRCWEIRHADVYSKRH